MKEIFQILLIFTFYSSIFGACNNSRGDFHTLKDSFVAYTKNFNRNFKHEYEENRHFDAFRSNYELVQAHNKLYESGKVTYALGLNNMADLSNERYLKNYVRLTKSERDDNNPTVGENFGNEQDERSRTKISSTPPELKGINIPERIDWRSKGFVTTIDNQGKCGACYALSVVHSIEGQLFKRTGKIIPLSVQQLVDCSIATGNHGCGGGSLRNTLKYLESYGGIMREDDYPYDEKQGKCNFIEDLSVVNITSWNILPANDENAIKIAVATIGPIAVSINASPSTFQLYKEGIYDDNSCKSNIVNHAILVVGYTPDYWILKNWWGKEWGEDGYVRMKRGKNMCGIARYAAYAVV